MTDQLAFQEIYIDDDKKRKVLRDGLDEFMRDGKLIALGSYRKNVQSIGGLRRLPFPRMESYCMSSKLVKIHKVWGF